MRLKYIYAICVVIIMVLYWYLYKKDENIFQRYYYFDANGTTPIHPQALVVFTNNAYLGNASAIYADNAKQILHETKDQLKKWCNVPEARVIFNSGASEGNNHILQSFATNTSHIILSSIEHKTSIECAKQLQRTGQIELSFVEPNAQGVITTKAVSDRIQNNTKLISVMSANNETGTIMPIMDIARLAQHHNIVFHSDAVQYIGKYPIDMSSGPDIITGSFHKFHGPNGLGFIICKCPGRLNASIHGSQFKGLRGGTENIAAIAAAGAAMKITFSGRRKKNNRMAEISKYILDNLHAEYDVLPMEYFTNRPDEFTLPHDNKIYMVQLSRVHTPNTLTLSFIKTGPLTDKFCNIILRDELFKNDVVVSIGSACNTASSEPSHVMTEMKLPFIIRAGMIRISTHDLTQWSHVKKMVVILKRLINSQLSRLTISERPYVIA